MRTMPAPITATHRTPLPAPVNASWPEEADTPLEVEVVALVVVLLEGELVVVVVDGSVVVVLDGLVVDVVDVEVLEVVEVEVVVALPAAMTGSIALPEGVCVVIPVGTELLA